MSGHGLTLDGRGAVFVLPGVFEAARRRAHEIAKAMSPLTELSAR